MPNNKKKVIRAELDRGLATDDEGRSIEILQEALGEGLSASELFVDIVQPVLYGVGKRFERLEIFLPELMRAASIIKTAHDQVLAPAIRAEAGEDMRAGTLVIGTCKGDIHDIGKNMVALMLQVNGFEVVDLGTDVSTQDFIDAARTHEADLIGMSSLLTPSMPYMRDLIERLNDLGLRDQYGVVVGGAPVTQSYAKSIGADAYGSDAANAVEVCLALMDRPT
jgi:methylmalonyl-CoA mutase cobalamin-binding domain/chain